jgi:hypothetical protein
MTQSSQFIFRRTPYANRRNPAQIYRDMSQHIPPAKEIPLEGPPSEIIQSLWDILNACWATDPEARPSADTIEEFLVKNEDVLKVALESDFILTKE